MKKIDIFLIIFLFAPFISFSQVSRLKYANRMYESKAYYYASEGFEDVLARNIDSMYIAPKIADSYDKIGNAKKAVKWYTYIKNNGQLTQNQQIRLALLERELGNYQEADKLLSDFIRKYGENSIAREILSSKVTIDDLKKGKKQFDLKMLDVNTPSSDICASYFDDSNVLFSCSKRRSRVVMRLHAWTGNYFYDNFKAPIDSDGNIGKATILKKEAKTKFHDGPVVYSAKTGRVYFTRNNYISGKKELDSTRSMRLTILCAKIEGRKFVDIQELSINENVFSNAHPFITPDGSRMYFSSDRPGGYGGMDIYYVDLDQNGLPKGEAVNMGEMINTSQHEVFPSYNSEENLLFFSSEGHFGLGGLDIYVAKLSEKGKAIKIENLASPINSEYDDFFFVSDEKQTKGYFTSNRYGGKGDDDIYAFKQYFPIKNSAILKGNTKDLLTDENLSESMVYLVNKEGTILDSTLTDPEGNFEMLLENVNDDFSLLAKKNNYIDASKTVPFVPDQFEYEEQLKLMPRLDYFYSGVVDEEGTNAPLAGVKVTVTDNKTHTPFATLTTNGEGKFRTGYLPYEYNNQVSYSFKLEKEGYLSSTISDNQTLAMKSELVVNGNLPLLLTKIKIGTDLNEILHLEPIYFDFNKWNIRPDAAIELDKVVAYMKENPTIVIELGSHTDSRGSAASNMILSDKRAKSSAAYIISKGISKDRIYGKGYGESRLKVSDAEINKATTAEEKERLHQLNRRTEFIIVKETK
jgi:outer membrane protein OmpA-like peptidoglycan-associated protein